MHAITKINFGPVGHVVRNYPFDPSLIPIAIVEFPIPCIKSDNGKGIYCSKLFTEILIELQFNEYVYAGAFLLLVGKYMWRVKDKIMVQAQYLIHWI